MVMQILQLIIRCMFKPKIDIVPGKREYPDTIFPISTWKQMVMDSH